MSPPFLTFLSEVIFSSISWWDWSFEIESSDKSADNSLDFDNDGVLFYYFERDTQSFED